jgi:hypothetical protein
LTAGRWRPGPIPPFIAITLQIAYGALMLLRHARVDRLGVK